MNSSAPLSCRPAIGRRAALARGALVLGLSLVAGLPGLSAQNASLDAVARAMGTPDLNSLTLVASGSNGTFGQSFRPGGTWPTFKVLRYEQAINFTDGAMRIQIERTNPDGPLQGSGLPIPPPLPQRQPAQILAPGAEGPLALQLWMSPHGVVKAAQRGNATLNGRVLSFTAAGSSIRATLGADNTIQKVETLIDNPVTGDTPVEWEYSNYRDFGGVKYPTRIVQRQGGLPILDLTVSEVRPNAAVMIDSGAAQKKKKGGGGAGGGAPTVTINRVGEGVHHATGGSHHSLIVEFNDLVVLFEVPQNDARALAVIEATRRQFPNKPIRYVVNSHHHFDHAGGIRAAMAEGLTLITQEQNKPYFERIAAMPHTLNPDKLASSPRRPVIEGVATKRVLTDGSQTLELHKINSNHVDTMLVAYLPRTRQLFEVDLYTPAGDAPPTSAPSFINPNAVALYDEIMRLNLDVQQIVPGHGPRLVSLQELRTATGK